MQGVDNKGNVIVYMKGHMWTFNPLCIKLAEKEEKQEVTGEGTALQKSLLVVFKLTATLHSMYLQGLLLMYVLLMPVHMYVCTVCIYTCTCVLPDTTVLGEETALLELKMQALLEEDNSEVLAHAALLGHVSIIRDYLDKYPNEVITKVP